MIADYTNDTLRRTRLDYLNETYVTYEYNDADWVTELYNTKENQGDISQFTYSHDQVGNRLSMATSQGTHNYTYDNIYQLTHVDYPAGDPFSDMTYDYDPVGNRNSTVNGGTVSYSHNELNEYTSVGGTSYTLDQRGNLISDGSQSYTYDLDNRLTDVGQNISYKYDPFGKMIEKNVASSITKYIHSGDQIIEDWEGETLARKYVYGMGINEPLVMITSGGSKYYYHFDALGNVRNLTDSSGDTVASYRYNVYGAFSLSGSSYGNPYTFTGRQWDSESSLYYYRARHYSPAIGRFLQTDPIGYGDGPNLYTYVRNNPIKYIDPFGLNPYWGYATIEEAVRDFVSYIGHDIFQNREYGAWIHRSPNGEYYYDGPIGGTRDEVDLGNNPENAVADIHTHGDSNPGCWDDDFSDEDIEDNDTNDIPGYLYSPSCRVSKYDPDTGAITNEMDIENCGQ